MSKTWDTKKRIIKLLLKGNMTLTEISAELGLAPSTVSKHIEELNRIGAIHLVDNPYIKKWKYYRADPDFSPDQVLKEGLLRQRLPQITAATIAIIIGIFLIYGFVYHSGPIAQQKTISIQITDPPQVPAGTQALIANYSSISVHVVSEDGNSGNWISVAGGGTLNLTGLVNMSTIIANAVIPVNEYVDRVNFSINSARIIINGTSYSVANLDSGITASIEGNESSKNDSSVLIDLSPTILTVFTDNSTLFVMVPSVKTVSVGQKGTLTVGSTRELNETVKTRLSAVGPNVSITSAILLSSGKNTTFSITVKNNGNESAAIRNILLKGNFTALVIPGMNMSAYATDENALHKDSIQIESIPNIGQVGGIVGGVGSGGSGGGGSTGVGGGGGIGTGGTSGSTTTISGLLNETTRSDSNPNSSVEEKNAVVGILGIKNLTAGINVTVTAKVNVSSILSVHGIQIETNNASANVSAIPRISNLINVGVAARSFRVLNFLIMDNGTLILPAREGDLQGSGYLLASGASATFTFSGEMSIANSQIMMSTLQGKAYNVTVVGEKGLSISANVTS